MTDKKNNLNDNTKALSPEDLEAVSGGYLFNQVNTPGGGKCVWEVIDDKTGEVLATTTDKEEALLYCKLRKLNPAELRLYYYVDYLRTHHKLPKSAEL